MQKNTIDKLITLPKKTVRLLEASAKADNTRVKNLIEKIVINHVDENISAKQKSK